ncbi:tail tube protein [Vibrio phage 1.244.A._10N.261.54.C3]|nr:tail tube protein [Vibrio phage 1.244.A._10N.261.54.C3]AUR98700.1 tail tube protein [Vibrio phage 1.255.O._10N.286.45.F1]
MNDLANFISSIRHNGLARTNRFRVTIPLPKSIETPEPDESGVMSWIKKGIRIATILTGGTVEGSRGLQVMCSSVQLPGTNINTTDVNHTGHGFKIATGTTKTEVDFNFLMSGDMAEKTVLDKWKDIIVHPLTRKVGYYSDYTTDIQIDVLDSTDTVVYTSILIEAYPVLFNIIELNKEDGDNVLRYNVGFAYKRVETPSIVDTSSPLDALSPVQLAKDVINGDIDGAAMKVRDMHKKYKAGTLKTDLGMQTYGMCGNVLNQSVGVGAQDMEGVVGGLVSTVKGTEGLDPDDSNTIVEAVQSVL